MKVRGGGDDAGRESVRSSGTLHPPPKEARPGRNQGPTAAEIEEFGKKGHNGAM